MTAILKNEPNATLRVACPIPFYNLDGQLFTGQTFLTASGEVQTYTMVGGWVAAANNAAALGSGGNYSYQYSQAETNDNTIIGVRLIKAGYATVYFWNPIIPTSTAADVWDVARAGHATAGTFGEGVGVVTMATAAANTVRDAIMNYAHDTGVTIKGAFRRLDSLIAGKATGMKGAVAKFFMRDGITEAISAPQDTAAGTRSTATVAGSEL